MEPGHNSLWGARSKQASGSPGCQRPAPPLLDPLGGVADAERLGPPFTLPPVIHSEHRNSCDQAAHFP